MKQNLYFKRIASKKIKIIAAIDLDNTFLKNSNTIPKESKIALKLLKKNNITPVICTGRHNVGVIAKWRHELSEYIQYFILNNGASIYNEKNGQQIYCQGFKYSEINDVITFCLVNKIQIVSYTNIGILTNHNAAFLNHFMRMYHGYIHNYKYVKEFNNLIIYRFYIPFLYKFHHKSVLYVNNLKFDPRFEITPLFHGFSFNKKNINKGSGLNWLCKKLKFDIKNCVGFGDAVNDIPLAKEIGFFIAMPIASPNLLKYSDFQIKGNKKNKFYNAVVYYLKKLKEERKNKKNNIKKKKE